MLVLLPFMWGMIWMVIKALISPGHMDSEAYARHRNASTELIGELLSSWLMEDAVQKYEHKASSRPSPNSIPIFIDSKKIRKNNRTQKTVSNSSVYNDGSQYSSSTIISNENLTDVPLSPNSSDPSLSISDVDERTRDKILIEKHLLNFKSNNISSDSDNNNSSNKSIVDNNCLDAISSSNSSRANNTLCNSTTRPKHTRRKAVDIFAVPSMPAEPLEPDWDVVLGGFDHYDDANWDNFLIQSEVPLLIRKLLSFSSETLYIEKDDLEEPAGTFKMLVTTVNWIVTHQSKFTLREEFREDDLDGTASLNTFFFLTPRTLVQTKLKAGWNLFLHRQFDEHGCNLTAVDRDRHIAARRFYKRVEGS